MMRYLRTFLVLLAVDAVGSSPSSLCRDTESCIARVKQIVAAPRRFWFGEQRSALCSSSRSVNAVECHGPPQLAHFHSLASRLFRVKTYHSAYLRNLELFPRITYRAAPGHYRACEHDFFSGNATPVEADPDMAPVAPFRIRKKPEITWHGLQFDDEYVIVMTDVGFGTLNYLVVDFPKDPKILKDYEPSENFRPSPNPLVMLVFRKSPTEVEALKSAEDFDLPSFMLKHGLEDHLVGLSVVVVGTDAFAIEKQRLKGNVDNCHSLLRDKISRSTETTPPILAKLPTEELNSWLSVSFEQKPLQGNVCCQRVKQTASTLYLDPLGESTISALAALSPPSFSSLRISSTSSNYVNYHRQTRNFVSLSDELFTIAIVDGHGGHLHYLEVDIPAANLNAASGNGITKAAYTALGPRRPSTCGSFVFVLLSQSASLASLPSLCTAMCEQRRKFRIELFKQQWSLKLSAVSFTDVCYDLPFAYHVLSEEMAASQKRLNTTVPESDTSFLAKRTRM
ncbi:unnamed protein product [Caenorhabditis auriculariae]|uniref:Uncharacterized protein n=1 Tax=Caenorhabditis auriculariae TaxID=2777116 RepID=A0A8S1GRG8_9PELO|nr:unnamed protein product [Caenorhabditis auriculariae]